MTYIEDEDADAAFVEFLFAFGEIADELASHVLSGKKIDAKARKAAYALKQGFRALQKAADDNDPAQTQTQEPAQ